VNFFESVLELVIGYMIIFFLMGLIMIPTYKFIISDNDVQFCYVTYDGHSSWGSDERVYSLRASIEWGSDRIISSDLHSLSEAKEEADLIDCPLR